MDENRERYKIREEELIALIQGKSLILAVPNKRHIEIMPPIHGITLEYGDWVNIKKLLLSTVHPSFELDKLIKKIEERK